VATEWHFKVRLSNAGYGKEYLAWCAHVGVDLRNGPLQIALDEEVHFEFGTTPEEALSKLRREVLN
jgi:hypothetical protein